MKKHKCTTCGKEKSLDEYYKMKDGFYRWYCRACKGKRAKEYYHNVQKHNLNLIEKKKKYNARPEIKKRRVRAARDCNRRIRRETLEHYGGSPPNCNCCGEKNYEFLTLDHINNDGAKHRKELVGNSKISGAVFCRALKKHGFPNDPPLQVLCWNCNCARFYFGGCPHVKVGMAKPAH